MSNGNVRNYSSLQEIRDKRNFVFGCIWQIRDNLISIPNADRLNNRNYHFTRCVVIASNSSDNFDEEHVCISVVPISSKVQFKREFDVELNKETDGVLEDSIAMTDYIQPVLKADLYKCVGEISEDKKYELYDSISEKFGIVSFDTQDMVASGDDK